MRTATGSVGEHLLLQKDTGFSPRCSDEYEVKGVEGKDGQPDQMECYLECEDGQVSRRGRALDRLAWAGNKRYRNSRSCSAERMSRSRKLES